MEASWSSFPIGADVYLAGTSEQPGKLGQMDGQSPERALELIDTSPGIADALHRIDEMSDAELRALAAGEHPMFVEAAEGIIAGRHVADRASR